MPWLDHWRWCDELSAAKTFYFPNIRRGGLGTSVPRDWEVSAALPQAGGGSGRECHPAHLSVQPGSWGREDPNTASEVSQCRSAGLSMCPATRKLRSHSNCLILKIRNSKIASEGGDDKFIATRVTHAVYLAREKGLGVVCTACINKILLQIKRIYVL